jgi:hypothetical protein
MKRVWLAVCALCGLVAGAHGQALELQHLDRLTQKSEETVNVTLDGNLLKMAAGFLSEDDKDSAEVKKVVSGLRGVYVRSFKFAKDGEYLPSDLKSVQDQLKGSEWSRIVDIREGVDKSVTTVYVRTVANKIGGIAIIAAQPRELTVVNIVGDVDLEKLQKLGGQMGIPKVDIEKKQKSKAKEDEE